MAYVSMSDLAQVTADQRAQQIQALEANATSIERAADAMASAAPAAAAAQRSVAAGLRAQAAALRNQSAPAAAPSMMDKVIEVAKSPLGMAAGAAALIGGGWAWWRSRQA